MKSWYNLFLVLTLFVAQEFFSQATFTSRANGNWNANSWVKQGILLGFRMGKMVEMSKPTETLQFFDKDTFPLRPMSLEDGVRIVMGGSAIRDGSYVAPSVVVVPPAYINVGSYVDEGTMVDSHALVGSCAQSPPVLADGASPSTLQPSEHSVR